MTALNNHYRSLPPHAELSNQARAGAKGISVMEIPLGSRVSCRAALTISARRRLACDESGAPDHHREKARQWLNPM
jgi:hypothetical protein